MTRSSYWLIPYVSIDLNAIGCHSSKTVELDVYSWIWEYRLSSARTSQVPLPWKRREWALYLVVERRPIGSLAAPPLVQASSQASLSYSICLSILLTCVDSAGIFICFDMPQDTNAQAYRFVISFCSGTFTSILGDSLGFYRICQGRLGILM